MKEVIVHPTPELHTTIHDVPIPIPGADEVLIKVIVAGSNVKDWLHPTARNTSLNSGDDVAGVVHYVGEDVEKSGEFRVGQRVGAFHIMGAPHGTYAEYAIAPASTTFVLPDNISFEEAATIPLISCTAALTLYRRLHLPPPWSPSADTAPPLPLIVYGASGALGTCVVKLARASGIHPIIAIAGGSAGHLEGWLDREKGDVLVDYRNGVEKMSEDVKKALNGLKCLHAVDAITSGKTLTWIPLSQMLSPSPSHPALLSVFSGALKYDQPEIPPNVQIIYTMVGTAHTGSYPPNSPSLPLPSDFELVKSDPDWARTFFRYIPSMLSDGRLSGHPYEILGGLESVERGLRLLKEGQAKGRKFVYKVGEE